MAITTALKGAFGFSSLKFGFLVTTAWLMEKNYSTEYAQSTYKHQLIALNSFLFTARANIVWSRVLNYRGDKRDLILTTL